MDAPDRRSRRGGIEHAERFERVDTRTREREVALVVARLQVDARRRRLDLRDRKPGTVEGDRQAGADQAAADDEDIQGLVHVPMITGA